MTDQEIIKLAEARLAEVRECVNDILDIQVLNYDHLSYEHVRDHDAPEEDGPVPIITVTFRKVFKEGVQIGWEFDRLRKY